jgi:ELWxxDGT repeat protein
MRTRLVLILLGLLCALPARGLEPYLVKDLDPVARPASSWPKQFVNLGSVALFSASAAGSFAQELWRSDGTKKGTWQVTHLCERHYCRSYLRPFGLTSRRYFFHAVDESSKWHLWATDGTPAGTFELSGPSVLAVLPGVPIGDVLYFTVDVGEGEDSVLELWRSDGTPAGTWRVTEQGAYSMVAFKGSLYFGGEDGALWKTDGTPAGTVRIKSISKYAPNALYVVGNRLVFRVYAYTPNPTEELWSSDGTPEGTLKLSGALWFPYFSVQDGRLYFVAEGDKDGQELWVTDGTPQNTRALTRLPRRDAFYSQAQGHFLELPRVAAGKRFVFMTDDGLDGVEPWVTDGTVEGTHLLKDLCPSDCEDVAEVWDQTLPGLVFLTVTEPNSGNELWVTDGTEAGTRLVRDICPGSCDAHPYTPFVMKDRLLFVADDGVDGYELWATDGTAANTTWSSDFPYARPWGTPGHDQFDGTVAGDQLLFRGPGLEGYELWRADGTGPSGTRLVRDISKADIGGSDPGRLMALGDQAFFFTYSFYGLSDITLWKSDGTYPGTVQVRVFSEEESGHELRRGSSARAGGQLFFFMSRSPVPWRTDGTETGTYPLAGEDVHACCDYPEMRAVDKTVFFPAADPEHGAELWASDGTVAGTRLVRDVEPGTSGSDPAGLTGFQGKLYFSAANEGLGKELWRSDGSRDGTNLVKDIRPGAGSEPSLLTVHAGRLWFFADDGEHGRELWSSDGTARGTALAVDVEPGAGSFEPSILVSLGNRLVFYGRSPGRGFGIWVTDGTAAGTRMISRRSMDGYAVFQGRVWFGSSDADSSMFLWVTDGTRAGTLPVLDRDRQPVSHPIRFAVLGDHLLFTAWEGGYERWLWESDGTPAGTFRLSRVANESELVRAGSRVFFPGFSPETGNELWAVEEATP